MINPNVAALILKIRRLEEELQQEYAKQRAIFNFNFHERKVKFERESAKRHRNFRKSLSAYVLDAPLLFVITTPIIYGVIVPLMLLDVFVTLYQGCCFPVYGIAKVKREDYLIFDRSKLGYLNAIEKLNCLYCSYANGLIGYVREISARTEQYWCPIKHAQRLQTMHDHYHKFSEFGDAENYHKELAALRSELQNRKTD